MAARTTNHAGLLNLEVIVGSYEQVLFGYRLINEDDLATLKLSFTDKSHCASIRCLAVSCKSVLASGSADETIELFNLNSRTEVGTLMKHSGTITHLEFHEDYLISSDECGNICIWKTGQRFECLRTLKGHKGAVNSMSIHPSGKLLLSVGADRTVRAWNLVTARIGFTTNEAKPVDLVKWSPEGDHYVLLTGNRIAICTVSSATAVHTVDLPGKGHCITFVSKKVVAVGCEGAQVSFIDIGNGTICAEVKCEGNRVKCVSSQFIDNDQCVLAIASNEGHISLHLVISQDSRIEISLLAATRTILRPICMFLAQHPEVSEKDCTSDLLGPLTGTKDKQKTATVSSKSINSTTVPAEVSGSAQKQTATGKRKTVATRNLKEPERKITRENQCKAVKGIYEEDQKLVKTEMDTIKKLFTSASPKAEQSVATKATAKTTGEHRKGLKKKHKKPVDSVKIAKEKISAKKNKKKSKESIDK